MRPSREAQITLYRDGSVAEHAELRKAAESARPEDQVTWICNSAGERIAAIVAPAVAEAGIDATGTWTT